MSNLRTPRVIAVLLAFILSGAGLALVLTVGLGGGPSTTPGGAVTGSTPTFTTAGDRWTLDEVLRRARNADIDAISAMTPAEGVGVGVASPVLIARTRNGDIHAIRPEVPIADALAVIRAAGYAPLLTDEAIALDPGTATGGLPSFVGLAMAVSLLVLAALLFARLRGAAGRSWRPSRVGHRRRTDQAIAGQRPSITLAEVAGCDEAKLELAETIEFLRTPERFHELGATCPAACCSSARQAPARRCSPRPSPAEAGVPFYYTSGSEFVEKYVGVGARRIRDLFAQARKAGKGVIFFDEFDALGKSRGGLGATRSASRRSTSCSSSSTASAPPRTSSSSPRPTGSTSWMPLLLRPGRFSRKIHVGAARRRRAARRSSRSTPATSRSARTSTSTTSPARPTASRGAQLADLLNEAAIMAARRAGRPSPPRTSTPAGSRSPSAPPAAARWTSASARSSPPTRWATRSAASVHGDKRRVEEISLFAHGEALGVTVSARRTTTSRPSPTCAHGSSP